MKVNFAFFQTKEYIQKASSKVTMWKTMLDALNVSDSRMMNPVVRNTIYYVNLAKIWMELVRNFLKKIKKIVSSKI